jgi:hypothetical protein
MEAAGGDGLYRTYAWLTPKYGSFARCCVTWVLLDWGFWRYAASSQLTCSTESEAFQHPPSLFLSISYYQCKFAYLTGLPYCRFQA